MRKVLIITYYWPPSAGAGVFRWLKFSKYLRQFGWEPVIYTPSNPESPGTDQSLTADIPAGLEVISHPIWEPYAWYKRFTGRKPSDKVQTGFLSENHTRRWSEDISTWIRGNFFIPDARKYWIKPSIKYLSAWLKQNPVDAIVSTGPPHSMHLIGLGLKKKTRLPWLADFRDPWTQIDFYNKLMLTPWADRKHHRLEQSVLQTADQVVTVSMNWAKGLTDCYQRDVQVVSNGYDPDDFLALPAFTYNEFSITHLGAMNADRNPGMLWPVLYDLVQTDDFFKKHLKIRLIGKTDLQARKSINLHGLDQHTNVISHLPHKEALDMAAQSALLLLPLNKTPNVGGIAPGKLYEYMALGRPVLCIGPENGDAARIINSTGTGYVTGFDDSDTCRNLLLQWKQAFLEKTLIPAARDIRQFSRQQLTGQIAGIFDKMIQNGKK